MGDKPLQFKPGEAIEFHSLIHPEPLYPQDMEKTDPAIVLADFSEETQSRFVNVSEKEMRDRDRLTRPTSRQTSKFHR